MSKYTDYLQSDEWKIKRELAIQQAGGRCRICDSTGPLQIHHRSYKRRGKPDEVLDLIALCDECHERHHKTEKKDQQIDDIMDLQWRVFELEMERLILLLVLIEIGFNTSCSYLKCIEEFIVATD